MRQIITTLTSAFVLALFLLLSFVVPSRTDQDYRTTHTTPAQLKIEYKKLRKELKNRGFINMIKRQKKDKLLDAMNKRLGIRKAPEFASLTDPQLKLLVREIEILLRESGTSYWDEDVREIYEIVPEDEPADTPTLLDDKALKAAKSVVAIVGKSHLKKMGDTWFLTTTTGGSASRDIVLCNFDTFSDQPSTCVLGTGFLVKPDIIATAGHVVIKNDYGYSAFLDSVYFLFDYVMKTETEPKTEYTDDQVYRGAGVLVRRSGENDFALIKLDSVIENRIPLPYRPDGQIPDVTSLYMIGHPNGLPQKYIGDGQVIYNPSCSYFLCNLHSHTYSSGSPVLNLAEHFVEGILVRDAVGTEQVCDCYVTRDETVATGPEGAGVTRSTEFATFLQNPDSVLVRCESEVGIVISVAGADTSFFDEGEEKYLLYNDLGFRLVINENCNMRYSPMSGEVWEIIDTYGGNSMRMQKVCFP